jgi:Ca-activated chloride channel family protein
MTASLRTETIGLIAFSGKAELLCPPTADYEAFSLALDDPAIASPFTGGTSISQAIKVALDAFARDRNHTGLLVILSDGEDHDGEAVTWARRAREQGVAIVTLGTGTPEGDLIPVTGESGGGAFLKARDGSVVKTRLREELLQEIAIASGGRYVRMLESVDLPADSLFFARDEAPGEGGQGSRRKELFQVFLAIAVLALLLESLLSDRKKGT